MSDKTLNALFNITDTVNTAKHTIAKTTDSTNIVPAELANIADNMEIISQEEIRSNYDLAHEHLVKALETGSELLEIARNSIRQSPDNSIYIERAAGLIRAINESSKSLASIHQDVGSILGNVKNIELTKNDNFIADSNDISDLIEKFKQSS